jgi:8-oxo-dGTP pyrophosphatase MutT (NUDIX family)
MLDLDMNREGVPPKDAATLILIRDSARGPEVFCVERNKKSRFMGGAVVFPGGKLDDDDRSPDWRELTTDPIEGEGARPLTIAACRESLEEAAILPVTGELSHEELLALRADIEGLRGFLASRGLKLDLARLHPFARWITPVAESRRFDARFYVAVVTDPRLGAHDDFETMSSFWATPSEVIERFVKGEIQLAPPTHRTLEILAQAASTTEILEATKRACLDPVCPRLVAQGNTMALTLPGDPEHDVKEPRSPGKSRYVLRGDRFLPEDAP